MASITAAATGATRERPLEDWLADAKRAEAYLPGLDGEDDPAIQAILSAGGIWHPISSKPYNIKRTLAITQPNSGFIGDGTATLLMATAAGAFDNASSSAAYRYAPNACGVLAQGVANPHIRGIKIKYANQIDDRYVKAVALRGCSEIDVRDIEASNFTKAGGVVYFGNCQGGRLQDVFVHDCHTNSSTYGQISGIDADNDDIGSNNIDLFDCRVERLTVGEQFRLLFGYQTDGYNFCRSTTSNIRFHRCKARNVGEGIDLFGYKCKLVGFDAADCYYFGAKMGHGASKNKLINSDLVRCGIAGVDLFGSDSALTDTADNLIENNLIADIDPDGVFASAYTSCVRLNPNGGTLYLPRRNIIARNHLICGNAKVGVLGWVGAGSDNEVVRNRVSGAQDGDYLFAPGVVSKLVPYYE